jgi:YhcH/YjgK/YiaL family protein
MEVCARAQLEVEEDALAEQDVCFLADTGPRSVFTVQAGEVAVFFPTDAHMPSLAVDEGAVIQKTCVKVEV